MPVLGCSCRVGDTFLTPPVFSSNTRTGGFFMKGISSLAGCDMGVSPALAGGWLKAPTGHTTQDGCVGRVGRVGRPSVPSRWQRWPKLGFRNWNLTHCFHLACHLSKILLELIHTLVQSFQSRCHSSRIFTALCKTLLLHVGECSILHSRCLRIF